MELNEFYILPRSGRYSSPRRENDALPLVYGDCTVGGSGGVWNCPRIDTGLYVYAVAGHPILSVADGNTVTVYDKNDQVISGANYTFSQSNDYQSQGTIAILTFTSDQQANEPIRVRAKGKAESGSLIENPIEVAADFLVTAGMVGEEIDSTWRARTAAHLEGLGVKIAGVLSTDETPARVLARMLTAVASWWRDGRNRFVFRPHLGPAGVNGSDIAAYLTPRQFKENGLEARASEEGVCTRAVVEYAWNQARGEFESFDDGAGQADLTAESLLGVRAKKFKLYWIRQAATVAKLQALIVAAYAQAPPVIKGALASLNHVFLEKGDVVSVSLDWLYDEQLKPWRNQLCRVLTVRPDFSRQEVSLELMDLGIYLAKAYPADGSYTAAGQILAGGQRDRNIYA